MPLILPAGFYSFVPLCSFHPIRYRCNLIFFVYSLACSHLLYKKSPQWSHYVTKQVILLGWCCGEWQVKRNQAYNIYEYIDIHNTTQEALFQVKPFSPLSRTYNYKTQNSFSLPRSGILYTYYKGEIFGVAVLFCLLTVAKRSCWLNQLGSIEGTERANYNLLGKNFHSTKIIIFISVIIIFLFLQER